MGSDPEVIGADGPANRMKMSTDLAVLARDFRVQVDNLNGTNEISYGRLSKLPNSGVHQVK